MPPALLSLAPELLYAITERVNKNDRKRLRLTCKYLGDILESEVLHTIYFNIQHHNYSQATTRLQSLATTKNLNISRGLSRSGRHLFIGPLSPKPEDGPEVPVVEELMRTYLRDALDALRSIQFVTWTPEKKDEAWTHEIIMDFLTSRPSLHALKVELSHLRIAVPLDRMQDLQKITFVERYRHRSSKPVRVQTYNNLAKLLASRPADQITKLSVVLTSLHEIFQFLTPEVEPLRLKVLQMTQSSIKLDPFIIPHLRHLTCLHLSFMKNPSDVRMENSDASEDTSPEISGDLENSEHRIESKMSDFWSALRHAGIHLREITVDSINPGLFGYLTHYSGLTNLVVTANVFDTSPDSDALARLFFAEPLASHIETLEELAVHASFEDLWCFGEHNISAFSRCTGLEQLGVSVAKADLPNAPSRNPEVDPAQSQPDVIKKLLDMVSTHMPRLSYLSISPSNEERFRGATRQAWASTFMQREAVAQLAIESLLAYPIPPSAAVVQFPTVCIWWRIFEPNFASPSPDEATREQRGRRYQETEPFTETEDLIDDQE